MESTFLIAGTAQRHLEDFFRHPAYRRPRMVRTHSHGLRAGPRRASRDDPGDGQQGEQREHPQGHQQHKPFAVSPGLASSQ